MLHLRLSYLRPPIQTLSALQSTRVLNFITKNHEQVYSCRFFFFKAKQWSLIYAYLQLVFLRKQNHNQCLHRLRERLPG